MIDLNGMKGVYVMSYVMGYVMGVCDECVCSEIDGNEWKMNIK